LINFQTDYISRLNAQYQKGQFLKAVIVTESPSVTRYFVHHEDSITFEGHAYTPLAMHWENIKTSMSMPTEGMQVALSNVGNQVVKYLKEVDITGNEVVMQLIHLDLLSTLTNYWRRKTRVRGVRADMNAAVFILGRELGQNQLPRRVMLAEEYPGISSEFPTI
jgi:hypothetical protein